MLLVNLPFRPFRDLGNGGWLAAGLVAAALAPLAAS